MNNKNINKTTLKTLLILSIASMMLIPGGFIPVHAAPGDTVSTVEINDSTANGPTLSNNDIFGRAIANLGDLDGDGVQDIAVGTPNDDDSGSNRGAIHIMFMNADGSVDSTVEINDSTTNGPSLANGDEFGMAIANLGDLDGDGVQDIAVGATRDDGSGTDRGAIHIMFMNADGSVDSTVEINDSTTNGPTLTDSDQFGSSITNLGDLDGDGVQDIAVGARLDDNSGTNRGTIHIIFLDADGTPKSTVEINSGTANGPVLSDYNAFGVSVSNIGDLDGDGIIDIVVGAWNDDTIHIIFLDADGTPKSTVEINSGTANGPVISGGDEFGTSVSNIGDLNGDGITDIAVGAHFDDNGGSNRGAIHIIFLDTDGTPKSAVEINDSTTNGPSLTDIDEFGYAVANLGDLNGDGIPDIAVGAIFDDNSGADRGAVHIISLKGIISWIPFPLIDGEPLTIHCDSAEEYGRASLDTHNSTAYTLYLCTPSGWIGQ